MANENESKVITFMGFLEESINGIIHIDQHPKKEVIIREFKQFNISIDKHDCIVPLRIIHQEGHSRIVYLPLELLTDKVEDMCVQLVWDPVIVRKHSVIHESLKPTVTSLVLPKIFPVIGMDISRLVYKIELHQTYTSAFGGVNFEKALVLMIKDYYNI